MGNLFSINNKKYRVLNDECLLELEPNQLRRDVVKLSDEVQNLRSQLRLTDDRLLTDTYNFNERLKLIQKDLESLVTNDKLLLDEVKKLKTKKSGIGNGNGNNDEVVNKHLEPINELVLSHQIIRT
jgi:hypothetical protein